MLCIKSLHEKLVEKKPHGCPLLPSRAHLGFYQPIHAFASFSTSPTPSVYSQPRKESEPVTVHKSSPG